MRELTFYRQKRHDGGIRTGVELDGSQTLLIDFREGPADQADDPLGSALIWYVDLRCRGGELPTEHEAARSWFREHRGFFRGGLMDLADQLAAGTDDSFPIRWSDPRGPIPGVETDIVCSAIRRLTGRELAENLRETGANLETYLQDLAAPEPLLR